VADIKKLFIFLIQLGKKALDDDLFAMSNELAYKILLSFFPFMVFLVSLLGFLNLEDSPFVARLFEMLPVDVGTVVGNFMAELQARPSPGLLSISLFVSIYSASNGFRALIRSVNKSHDFKDERNWIKKIALSAGLMLIFTFSIIIMLGLWLFNDILIAAIESFTPLNLGIVAQVSSWLVAIVVLIGVVAWMYRLACAKPGDGRVLPGACVTVLLWVVSSEVFGIFISHFSNISILYGSIAGVFILIIWLNLISSFLLLGNTVNVVLDVRKEKGNKKGPF